MTSTSLVGALLVGAILATQPEVARAQTVATAPDATPSSADADSRIAQLQAQIDALQKSLAEIQASIVKTTPSWKGAPQMEDKKAGWSFKPRGRLMYDVGSVNGPDGLMLAPSDVNGLGMSNEVRRARLGVEGTVPGGFGYKFELDFADGVEFADAFLNYKTGAWEVTVGQHNNFQSLDELTSSLHSSFIERAAFTDAFGFERRVGVSAQYGAGAFLAQAGLFSDSVADLNSVGDSNNSYSADGRLIFAPLVGASQLHVAGSFHYRDLNHAGTTVRYRQRPVIHTTDVRFVNTGSIADAESEVGYGLEAAGIFGRLHAAGEAYWQKVGRTTGDEPTFFGAYIEGGYFFTGESRGYKAGKFDRVKVLKGFDKGGWGALSLNLRWDYLDLKDAGIIGGTQHAYQASLNWKPTDYVLFGLNAAHVVYDDAAIATTEGKRDYDVNIAGLRAQIDF